jgi:hypothetical protein
VEAPTSTNLSDFFLAATNSTWGGGSHIWSVSLAASPPTQTEAERGPKQTVDEMHSGNEELLLLYDAKKNDLSAALIKLQKAVDQVADENTFSAGEISLDLLRG